MHLVAICLFSNHVNKSLIFVFGAFVYYFKNTISIFVTILLAFIKCLALVYKTWANSEGLFNSVCKTFHMTFVTWLCPKLRVIVYIIDIYESAIVNCG